MDNPKSIIDFYKKYRIQDGQEVLMEARRKLSCYCVEIAEDIKGLEGAHKETYQERKISEATRFLKSTAKTAAARSAESIDAVLRRKEGVSEGQLQGNKIMLSSYNKVLDSMASIINALNR